MVTAWDGTRVGQAQADIVIRDPVVLTGTLPRFLNVGDRSRFFVALDNVEGAGGDYTVDLDLSGPSSSAPRRCTRSCGSKPAPRASS